MDSEKTNEVTNDVTNGAPSCDIEATTDQDSIVAEEELCFFCRQKATKSCSYCKISSYCCDEHGVVHRPNDVCFPYRVEYSQNVGNYLVATRDITPTGTVEISYTIFYELDC